MKDTLKNLLATKFQGVSDKILSRVAEKLAKTAHTEEEATSAVDGFSFQQFLEFYGDTRATEASQTAVRNYEAKHRKQEDHEEEEKHNEGDETPAWAKSLVEANKALTERLNAMERGKVTENRRSQLGKIIEKLPSSLRKAYERTPVDSLTDDEFAELTTSISSEVEGIMSETQRKGVIFGQPKSVGVQKNASEASDEELKAVTDKLHL